MRLSLCATLVIATFLVPASAQIKVARFKQNPLITTRTSRSLDSRPS